MSTQHYVTAAIPESDWTTAALGCRCGALLGVQDWYQHLRGHPSGGSQPEAEQDGDPS